jgi:hypothetical protein
MGIQVHVHNLNYTALENLSMWHPVYKYIAHVVLLYKCEMYQILKRKPFMKKWTDLFTFLYWITCMKAYFSFLPYWHYMYMYILSMAINVMELILI